MSDSGDASARLDKLETATERLIQEDTEQSVCAAALESAQDIFDTDVGGVWLYDADAHELQYTVASQTAKRRFDPDVVYRPGNSLSWEAFEAGELRVYSAADDHDVPLYNTDSAIQSEMVLPIGDYGVMNIGHLEQRSFGPRDQQTGRILALNVENALERIYREHELEVEKSRVEEFVSIISHDLRNPIEVSSNYLALIAEEYDDERFEKVAGGIERIEDLTDGLLALTKQGSVVDTRTTVDLATISERAWTNVYTPDADLTIDDSIDIFGDEKRLLQVFENLFRNAIEHAGDSVSVRVGSIQTIPTSTRVSSSGGITGFYVEDDGEGIPAAERADIFAAGWSTESTGLGLAIVQRIADAHGWDVAATQSAAAGARFEITTDTKSVAPFESP